MTVTNRLLTAEDLFRMPSGKHRYELVRGVLRAMTPTGLRHGAVTATVTAALIQHVRAKGLGIVFAAETGFKIETDPDTVRAPDVAFVRRDRLSSDLPAGFGSLAPDLAVEVLSPSDTVFEVEEKTAAWLAAGVRAVWIINPKQRTVAVHVASAQPRLLSDQDILDGGDVVPGFEIRVADLFA